jgi:hypothetical protein
LTAASRVFTPALPAFRARPPPLAGHPPALYVSPDDDAVRGFPSPLPSATPGPQRRDVAPGLPTQHAAWDATEQGFLDMASDVLPDAAAKKILSSKVTIRKVKVTPSVAFRSVVPCSSHWGSRIALEKSAPRTGHFMKWPWPCTLGHWQPRVLWAVAIAVDIVLGALWAHCKSSGSGGRSSCS